MKPGSIAALAAGAAVALGLAACSGSSGGSSPSSAPPQSAPAQSAPAQSVPPAPVNGPGGLTPPGTHLGFGQAATVAWNPLSGDSGLGAHKGLKLQVTVLSIEKGTIDDFKNVDLDSSERESTPYYVTLRIKALENTPPPSATDDPAITFDAIDDRGQQQGSITFFGTFERCDETNPPKPFTAGKSYESCLAYLMPGGGSIQQVQWNDGPNAANDVTPYFDKPIVWSGS